MKTKLQRFAVIGLPGSGKSTFSLDLAAKLELPVHHVDKHIFDGKTKIKKEGFMDPLVKEEKWIIEGCSFSTFELRFARAEKIYYFNLPRYVCIWRSFKRIFTMNKALEQTGCLKGINWALIKYIWNFDKEKRATIEQLCQKYPHVEFIEFTSQKMVDDYLRKL